MVAMPYVLVNIVLDIFSLIFFCVTSAALLSRYRLAGFCLPAQIRNRKALAFVAFGLALSIVAVLVMARYKNVYIFSLSIFDLFFFMGIINSLVLAYQFMDKRYFLNTPKLQRRLLISIFSIVMTFVPVIAVVIAMVGLFIIK
jgi:hypothetical protein